MLRDPFLSEIIKAIQIYSELPQDAVMRRIREEYNGGSRDFYEDVDMRFPHIKDAGLRMAGIYHGLLKYGIPMFLYPEICEAGRQLTPAEKELMHARDRLDRLSLQNAK